MVGPLDPGPEDIQEEEVSGLRLTPGRDDEPVCRRLEAASRITGLKDGEGFPGEVAVALRGMEDVDASLCGGVVTEVFALEEPAFGVAGVLLVEGVPFVEGDCVPGGLQVLEREPLRPEGFAGARPRGSFSSAIAGG